MSAIDILRSFADAREPDDAVIRNGITYGVARQLVRHITEADALRGLLRTIANDRITHLEAGVRWVRLYPEDEAKIAALDAARATGSADEVQP